jgi:DnaJ-class molecular chaperone
LRIKNAYQTLVDSNSRAKYDASQRSRTAADWDPFQWSSSRPKGNSTVQEEDFYGFGKAPLFLAALPFAYVHTCQQTLAASCSFSLEVAVSDVAVTPTESDNTNCIMNSQRGHGWSAGEFWRDLKGSFGRVATFNYTANTLLWGQGLCGAWGIM